MKIIMVLWYLFRHENTRRSWQIIKIKGQFSQNIRTKGTGSISQVTGLICRQNELIRSRQRMKPVHLVLIFFCIFFFFFKFLLFVRRESITTIMCLKKLLIPRSSVVSLNYPFKEAFFCSHFNDMESQSRHVFFCWVSRITSQEISRKILY